MTTSTKVQPLDNMKVHSYELISPMQLRSQVGRMQELIFQSTQGISKLRRDLDTFKELLHEPDPLTRYRKSQGHARPENEAVSPKQSMPKFENLR